MIVVPTLKDPYDEKKNNNNNNKYPKNSIKVDDTSYCSDTIVFIWIAHNLQEVLGLNIWIIDNTNWIYCTYLGYGLWVCHPR